jgi:hypothetical protein
MGEAAISSGHEDIKKVCENFHKFSCATSVRLLMDWWLLAYLWLLRCNDCEFSWRLPGSGLLPDSPWPTFSPKARMYW